MEKTKAEEPMRTMTKERKKEGPRLGHKGRADAKASRQLLLLCIPAIIGYILFNYIPMGAAVIIPFKNYKFSKGILGSAWYRASFGTAFAIVQQKRHPAPMPCRAAHKGRYAAHTARRIFAVQRHKASS